ncbi:MAG: hypothetical protein WAX85_00075 [Minisyncoccia bacterium]
MNNNKIKIIAGGVILAGLSFYGGMKYDQSKVNSLAQSFRSGNFAGQAANRGVRGGAGGVVAGDILSKDANGVTVKDRDGSSKIVLISGSTSILKTVSGSSSDLDVGKMITVMGTANSDGSVTAESIQIRQATTTRQQ